MSDSHSSFSALPGPWGRNGEQISCYVVSLHCLLRDTPPNKAYQKVDPFLPSPLLPPLSSPQSSPQEGRRAMIRLIEECMGDSSFPFTTELLKDSLRLYLSAYGQVRLGIKGSPSWQGSVSILSLRSLRMR
jgi:hypothetical protein